MKFSRTLRGGFVRHWPSGWEGRIVGTTDLLVFAVDKWGIERFFTHHEASYTQGVQLLSFIEPSYVWTPADRVGQQA
jgi:hypothetical protein